MIETNPQRQPAVMIPAVLPQAPRRAPPPGACDTHTHIIGPEERFPLAHPPSEFAPPLAPAEDHRRMLDIVGLDRCIAVQAASLQGLDMSALVDGLASSGGRLRGVGVTPSTISDSALAELDKAGMRALRFVETRTAAGEKRPGSADFDEARKLAPRMAALGWHMHLWGPLAVIMADIDDLLRRGVPIVLDHMGMVDVKQGVAAPDFQRLVALVRERRVHVKLSLCRISSAAPDYADARPFHDALVTANPDALLWGSDWPYIRMQGREPDVGALLDLFQDWCGDDEIIRKILVDNPARLFRFPA